VAIGLPINPLYRDPNPTVNAQIAYEIANLIRCFAPQFGPLQEGSFCKAYQQLDAPDFPSLVHALENTATPALTSPSSRKSTASNYLPAPTPPSGRRHGSTRPSSSTSKNSAATR